MTFIRISEDLPPGVNAFVMEDAQGDHNIYLNDRLSPSGRLRALAHELDHIRHGDLRKHGEVPAHAIEAERRNNGTGAIPYEDV